MGTGLGASLPWQELNLHCVVPWYCNYFAFLLHRQAFFFHLCIWFRFCVTVPCTLVFLICDLWEGLGSPVYPNCIDLETYEILSHNPEYPGHRPMWFRLPDLISNAWVCQKSVPVMRNCLLRNYLLLAFLFLYCWISVCLHHCTIRWLHVGIPVLFVNTEV